MNPLLDQLSVAAIIAGALAFFVVRFFKKRAGGKSCDSGCGCGSAKMPAASGGKSKDLRSA